MRSSPTMRLSLPSRVAGCVCLSATTLVSASRSRTGRRGALWLRLGAGRATSGEAKRGGAWGAYDDGTEET
jgi:hypothetical protein